MAIWDILVVEMDGSAQLTVVVNLKTHAVLEVLFIVKTKYQATKLAYQMDLPVVTMVFIVPLVIHVSAHIAVRLKQPISVQLDVWHQILYQRLLVWHQDYHSLR